MMQNFRKSCVVGACALAAAASHALTFKTDDFSGSFDSSLSTGTGVRLKSPNSALILSGNTGGPPGIAAPIASGLGDQGNLNYDKGDPFALYLKGTHELLLQMPQDFRFMGRVNWVRDFAATHTTGWRSSASVSPDIGSDGLTDDARRDLRFKARVLDLWLSKSFAIGEQQARVRVGNQVISWGESIITPGGINATNPVDVMRLSQPGTQIKEGILPVPTVSFATGLSNGLSTELYWQTNWKASYLPPSGSYWSVVNGLGKGNDAFGVTEDRSTRDGGQWGASLRWKPAGTSLDVGAYVLSYHDKAPQVRLDQTTFATSLVFPENRKLYGVSANFPLGDWAVGTELSYRPNDAVFLNPNTTGCASQGGNCWVDEKKLQWHLTGLLQMSPGNAGALLSALGASNGLFLSELVVIHYPKLKKNYGGDFVAAGGWGWGNAVGSAFDPAAAAGNTVPAGSKTSSGLNLDMSVTYDGNLIPGWQVSPGLFVSWALAGRTPNIQGTWMKGARATNLYVNFTQNPATWQFGVNWSTFSGGSSVFDQPLRDRDFIGVSATANF